MNFVFNVVYTLRWIHSNINFFLSYSYAFQAEKLLFEWVILFFQKSPADKCKKTPADKCKKTCSAMGYTLCWCSIIQSYWIMMIQTTQCWYQWQQNKIKIPDKGNRILIWFWPGFIREMFVVSCYLSANKP